MLQAPKRARLLRERPMPRHPANSSHPSDQPFVLVCLVYICVFYICMSIHAPCHAPVSTYASLRAVSHLWASFPVEIGLSFFTNPPALEPVAPSLSSFFYFFPLLLSFSRVFYFTCVDVCCCACMCLIHICLSLAVVVCVCKDVCVLPEQLIIQHVFCRVTNSVKVLSHVTVIASEWVTK